MLKLVQHESILWAILVTSPLFTVLFTALYF